MLVERAVGSALVVVRDVVDHEPLGLPRRGVPDQRSWQGSPPAQALRRRHVIDEYIRQRPDIIVERRSDTDRDDDFAAPRHRARDPFP